MGGREDPRPDDGPGHRDLFRHREEAKEEADAGLPLGEPEVPQLVGLQVLPLRGFGLSQRCR